MPLFGPEDGGALRLPCRTLPVYLMLFVEHLSACPAVPLPSILLVPLPFALP